MADARLEVTDALGRRIVPIGKSRFEIGRRETNDLRLAGSEVSRDHAEVTIDGDHFTLRDRNSRYGTYVNGEQITERVLVHGDKVRLGRSGGAEMMFLLADERTDTQTGDLSSDVAGVAVVIERRLTNEEYFAAIAAALERDTVHCPTIDSGDLHRELQDSHSLAFRFLHKGFHRVVEFDARAGCDARGVFDLTCFLGHISRQMSDAFGLHLPHDEFHPEEISQVLKDEQRPSLFCVLNVNVIPSDQLRGLRGFGQEHHRMLLCGPHILDGVKARSIERVERYAESRPSYLAGLLAGLRAIGDGRVLNDVLALVLDSAIEVSGTERGFIMLATPMTDTLEVRMARGRGQLSSPGKAFATSRRIPEEVLRTGEPRIVADLLDGDLVSLHMNTVALGIRNVICVPLRAVTLVDQAEPMRQERRIGVLYLDSKEKGSLFSGSTRAALETLATEAAVAIENARLYRETMEKARMEQEMRIAAEIQQAMLPKATRAGSYFRAAALSLPCRSIGGDFYDYVEMANGAIGFALGSVAGKGPPAALLGAMTQGMFVAYATNDEPSETIARVNLTLCRRGIESRFVTLMHGVLDADGQMVYCNAGHNAPLIIGNDGVRRLERGGPIVGLFEMASYEEERLRLTPGDWLIIFSDGISEALSAAGEEYGESRIIDCIQRNETLDPSRLLGALLADVREFARGAPQSDDITAMVLRYGS